MTEEEVERLVELIRKLVAAPGTRKEKRRDVLVRCNPDDKTDVKEFASWFD